MYRVQSTNPDFGESRLPRNVAWLSNPEAPRILRVLQQEILLAWPEIGGCQAKLLRRGLAQGGAAFQVEVSQGPIWQPARVQQHRLHMAAKTGTTLSAESVPSQISGDKDETALMKSKAAFVALEAVDGVGGVRVVDLLPATWYHVRLRVTYDGSCTAVGPPVAVAIKCAPPDAPMPRPKVIEEPVHPGCGGSEYATESGPAATPSVAVRTLGTFIKELAGTVTGTLPNVGTRLRVSWSRPRTNGYPIHHYILQQRELVTPPKSVTKAWQTDGMPGARTDDTSVPLARIGPRGDTLESFVGQLTPKWTPWREVHTNLLPECLIRAPVRCPASITAARGVLGLGTLSNNTASFGAMDTLRKGTESLPRFIAVEFRVAAVNALGISKFSNISRVTGRECPRSFAPAVHGRVIPQRSICSTSDRARQDQCSPNSRSLALEAELEQIVDAFEFPVSLSVVETAFDTIRVKGSIPTMNVPVYRVREKSKKKSPKVSTRTDPRLFSGAQRMLMSEIIAKPDTKDQNTKRMKTVLFRQPIGGE